MKSISINDIQHADIAIIGAGPVGIAAASYLLAKNLNPIILEMGPSVGHAVKAWGHVQVFTPWKYVIDKAVLNLLSELNWEKPDDETHPTGNEIVDKYLKPAATLTVLKNHIKYNAEVVSVTKKDLSKHSSKNRQKTPYLINYKNPKNEIKSLEASAVIDASGTWFQPNPMGLNGLPVAGEKENIKNIFYGIPDILKEKSYIFKHKRTLLVGGGHSAINSALDILKLKNNDSTTELIWGLKSKNIEKLTGGGINDALPARGILGLAAKEAIENGNLQLFSDFQVHSITREDSSLKLSISVSGDPGVINVDNIIVAAGFKPNLDILKEIRLDIDNIVEAPIKLAPLIDPNHHSCGTVKPHGVNELRHSDENFYIVGMKSYGRAPTFLMLTGYEQVRSIAAELAGDYQEARDVKLVLPETGVCNSNFGDSAVSCCPSSNDNSKTIITRSEIPKAKKISCCG